MLRSSTPYLATTNEPTTKTWVGDDAHLGYIDTLASLKFDKSVTRTKEYLPKSVAIQLMLRSWKTVPNNDNKDIVECDINNHGHNHEEDQHKNADDT